jgi:hypothetical protein
MDREKMNMELPIKKKEKLLEYTRELNEILIDDNKSDEKKCDDLVKLLNDIAYENKMEEEKTIEMPIEGVYRVMGHACTALRSFADAYEDLCDDEDDFPPEFAEAEKEIVALRDLLMLLVVRGRDE